jgi:hypothetical protein
MFSPLRLLLPVSAVFLSLPWVFKQELVNYYSFPVFYFFGSYFFFINFPIIADLLHCKPSYIEDLIFTSDGIDNHSFKKKYAVLMNFILALLFAAFSEYIIVEGIQDRSIFELLGVIGGNISLYLKVQNTMGKFLLEFCKCFKSQEHGKIEKRLLASISAPVFSTSNSDLRAGSSIQ